DNLTKQQTQILNTWVSYRTTHSISLKISTQLNYKTYKTTSDVKIEAPHDFSSINFTSVHTGSVKERYPKLVENIVRKRLARYGAQNTDPYVFFPEDENQKKAIKEIVNEIKERWEPGKSGYRPGDDAYRFARPEYIRRLSGISKQGSRYKYAGFEQLVHVSSGIIRFFLEPASRMFTEQLLKNDMSPVTEISPSIQDQELRKQADQLLLQEFDELEREIENNDSRTFQSNEVTRLRNLVQGIGALFKAHIMDEKGTQRRVFSFTISGTTPSKELKSILDFGVVHGYFYLDSIGTKNGLGRETLYVLTRRLAPAFSLDPIGFSNHLSIPSQLLLEMSERPQAYISRLKRKGVAPSNKNSGQLSLFDDGDSDE
ncbi:MAG: ORC-CDC6 family AAA ATPase, partial [Parachlamydiaceae bacterium]